MFRQLARRFGSIHNSKYFMELEKQFGCHNYHPLPVVLTRGQGVHVWDVEGRKYLDFLAAYSALNQGHVHPKILEAFLHQSQRLTLTSRAFYSDKLGPTEKYISELFGYDKTLFMNGGVEAGESAIKLARRWGYVKKGIPDSRAKIIFAKSNFWGRTIAACASSDDPARYYRFGPFDGLGFELIDYDSPEALEEKLKSDPNVAAFMVEAIQGEAGVIIPQDGYMRKVKDICAKYNVLLIADEIQSGLGRTGKMLACEYDGIKPDILLLGKALSGGFLPVSATLANDNVMLNIKPGEHGSTYGGNPLAMVVAKRAVEVLIEEKMIENSARLGQVMLDALKTFKYDFIKDVRGRGLFIALEMKEEAKNKITAWDFCIKLKERGLLAKPTHETTIRFTPPLNVTDSQLNESLDIIKKTLASI
eukprot:TRINITY_DN9759_c0_g1_i2.p1 TRINITY_DN9759_c0_g1~~TRINITY_DN9759_c0_g1_i2.p1  ORF type:complete len:419 (+),score=80.04 TRINITY_DN9759_c0_g1_i2:127-1383(+)